MHYKSAAILIAVILLFAIASALMLLIFQPNHCQAGQSAFYQLYIPLFLVNNIFITVMAFLYWIVVEKREEDKYRSYSAARAYDIVDSPIDEYSDRAAFINYSFYDNVFPWDYAKSRHTYSSTIAPSHATYL